MESTINPRMHTLRLTCPLFVDGAGKKTSRKQETTRANHSRCKITATQTRTNTQTHTYIHTPPTASFGGRRATKQPQQNYHTLRSSSAFGDLETAARRSIQLSSHSRIPRVNKSNIRSAPCTSIFYLYVHSKRIRYTGQLNKMYL